MTIEQFRRLREELDLTMDLLEQGNAKEAKEQLDMAMKTLDTIRFKKAAPRG